MNIQRAVADLARLGPFPASDDPDIEEKVATIEPLVLSIREPISDDDARVLVTLFGPDDLYGIAMTLMSVIETAPGWPLSDVRLDDGNEWHYSLKTHIQNSEEYQRNRLLWSDASSKV